MVAVFGNEKSEPWEWMSKVGWGRKEVKRLRGQSAEMIRLANHSPIWSILAGCLVLYGPQQCWSWLALWAPETNRRIPSLCPPLLPVPPSSLAGDHTSLLLKTHAGGHYLPTEDYCWQPPGTKLWNLSVGVRDSVSPITSVQLPKLKWLGFPTGKNIVGSGSLGKWVKLTVMAP